MTKFAQPAPGRRVWINVALGGGLIVLLFTIVFVPVYVTTKQEAAPSASRAGKCSGFQLPAKQVKPPKYAATSKRPNFIYILVDDQGYDDLRLHHPASSLYNFIKTPNLDRLVLSGTEFTNFYVTPMCSTSRAELLTGRYYARTGAMYINTGWDFINSNETNIAQILGASGYKTSVFGKWHNGRTAGYQPYDLGFQYSVLPTPYVYKDNLMYVNGELEQTQGWMEEVLMGNIINYLKQREGGDEPFFMYYPSFSVHAGWKQSATDGPRFQRPAPPRYSKKFTKMALSNDTAQVYAMLEYFDDQLGRLLRYLESSNLAETTYIMISGDNGPALFNQESKPLPRVVRMPSGMQGAKKSAMEGGVRNFLAVRGPGVAQGISSDALLGLVDVAPTIVELAGMTQVPQHLPWDGISFANIINGQQPTHQQEERLLFSMDTTCIQEDFVPELGPDRQTLKPQPLLDYTTGGVNGEGFKRCLGVRYKQYKWLGDARKSHGSGPSYMVGNVSVPTALYKFEGGLHLELPCMEVSRQEPRMLKFMEKSAEAFFDAMVNSSHSFQKAVFYIGLHGRPAVNIVADGAIERTPARVQVLPMGLSGFVRKGDSASYRIKVMTPGHYEITLYYQSDREATFRLWIGPRSKIVDGTAMHLDAKLPADAKKRRVETIGKLKLPATPPGQTWEVKLEMTNSTGQLLPAIKAFDTIYFKRVANWPAACSTQQCRLNGSAGAGGVGHVALYDPNSQEGVQSWKLAHGHKDVIGG
ncbi:alkaline-phosphatase-like protein [Scenedesmus sp. NREL 46B-D3]|nr:alkaline-phosphatase-like protein [Scenedesmus sp. NREL 46B-D3]